jgi:hypothetical protein
MDAFESIVAAIFQAKGYWVRTSYKVKLTPTEKRAIGCATSPRWEIDIVAYGAPKNELWAIECKSFFDSKGVLAAPFTVEGHKGAKRYKLFTEGITRDVVLTAMVRQLIQEGAIARELEPRLCLATGKIANERDHETLRQYFAANGWELLGPRQLRDGLLELAAEGYENSAALVATKLLLSKSL